MTTLQTSQPYQQLCELVNAAPITHSLKMSDFTQISNMAEHSRDELMTAALQVFIEMVAGDSSRVNKVNKVLIDHYIAKIDEALNDQLDAILHDKGFQQLESNWRSLKYLVDRTDFKSNIQIELMDVTKHALREDFENATDSTQSGLYEHLYRREYDTPGGEPFSAIVSAYEFDASAPDVSLLRDISKVSAVTHCPFIAAAGAKFFGKDHIEEVIRIDEVENYLDRTEYLRWASFRESDDARYIGLTLPRFLLRLPYGQDNPVCQFHYHESTQDNGFLWGNASFAFAANMTHCFKHHGWTVNIRGPEGGGKVNELPLHQYDVGRGLMTKIPTECIIPETRELELANLGFIPLSYYKNSDYACFFSANSIQKPKLYSTSEATANSRINARLPYIFLSSRLAHYMKVLQRENIGAAKSASELESELNRWLQTLVTKMNNPGPELIATHPLRDGKVSVEAITDNPGFYRVMLYAMPHFQIEGVDVTLSMVAQMPTGKK